MNSKQITLTLGLLLVVLPSALTARVVIPEAEEHYQQASTYSSENQPEEALFAMERALELDPRNIQYLMGHAQIANWLGRYDDARQSFERVLNLTPGDKAAQLGRARSAAWGGHLSLAARCYRDYVAAYPEDRQARLEYARVESWQGDFADSIELLDAFRRDFPAQEGAWREYLEDRARVLTAADRPTEGLRLVEPLLQKEPEDPQLVAIQALALDRAGRPGEALASVEILQDLAPAAPKTVEVERILTTPRRPVVMPFLSFYSDSDSVDRAVAGFDGGFSPSASTRFTVGISGDELNADPGSGLDSSDGREVRSAELWAAFGGRPTPKLWLEGRLGDAEIDGGGDLLTYRALARGDVTDTFQLTAESHRGFYPVSPKALEREIERTAYRLGVNWQPSLRYTVEASGGYDTFSDGNRYWEAVLAPRRAVLRRQGFNLDLGLRAWWFGFDQNPGNGYYAPEEYERYTVTSFSYWKINDNTGLSLVLGAGFFKDDTMEDFEFGGDAALELTVGVYRDWQLQLRGSYTENTRQASGAFDAWGGVILLSRRF